MSPSQSPRVSPSKSPGVSRSIWLLLPAYEEAESLPPLFADVRSTLDAWPDAPPCRVVVVDDGSTDATARTAQATQGLAVDVLVHPENRGLGVAMRTGIEHVLEHAGPDDVLVAMDADHTHPPELIPRMLERIDEGADLVIASRFQPGATVQGLDQTRILTSQLASRLLRLVFPGARDYTCGYRAYRVSLLRWGQTRYGAEFLNQTGFSVMVDLLLKLRRKARRIDEVPLTLRYDRKVSTSKMKILQVSMTTLALMARRYRGDPRGP